MHRTQMDKTSRFTIEEKQTLWGKHKIGDAVGVFIIKDIEFKRNHKDISQRIYTLECSICGEIVKFKGAYFLSLKKLFYCSNATKDQIKMLADESLPFKVRAEQAYDEGVSVSAIAKHSGRTYHTVYSSLGLKKKGGE